ncbi:MAG: hypothetical protein R3Y23_02980 [Bacillota bacterium]
MSKDAIITNEQAEKTAVLGKDWFKIDNAGKIYPASGTNKWNAVFRVTAIMNELVDIAILQKAVDDVMDRFPTYNVTLKKGMFWFYLQQLDRTPTVTFDQNSPCMPFNLSSGGHLVRITHYRYRIAIEMFHALSDGTGGLIFLNSIVARYLELKNINITYGNSLALNHRDKPTENEVEDTFLRVADLKECSTRSGRRCFYIKGTKEEKGSSNVVSFVMDEKQLKEIGLKYHSSITQFLSANLLLAIYDLKEQSKSKLSAVIELPINLRKIFASKTIRNFAYFTHIKMPHREGGYSVEDAISIVQNGIRQGTDKDYLMRNINANVRDESNLFLRLIPRPIKTFGMNIAFELFSDRIISTVFSALGRVEAPKEFQPHINRYEMVIGAPKLNNYACTAISYNNNYVMSFCKHIVDSPLETALLSRLAQYGIKPTIENNME